MHNSFARAFNKRHRLSGHLFQGRYWDSLIESREDFIYVSRYIHLNPVEARMVQHPAAFEWSSYAAFVSTKTNPHITTIRTFSYFPAPPAAHYQAFVETDAVPTDMI
ncbi:hypothetical protein [Salsuginibacillus halophilus]|uniref:hypothetical protein n=1 Tax=Salsuginibacillus halophilus TaxID=517424 RepID=UPI001FE9F77E|nr:hypothetical protein [Salsuginibacillus halophilus]